MMMSLEEEWWGYRVLKKLSAKKFFLLKILKNALEVISSSYQERSDDRADQVDQHTRLAMARGDIERARKELVDVLGAEARVKSGSGETVENLIFLLDNALVEIEAVEEYLRKIYVCEICGEPIEKGRLLVVPQTKHCAVCAMELASKTKPRRIVFVTGFA